MVEWEDAGLTVLFGGFLPGHVLVIHYNTFNVKLFPLGGERFIRLLLTSLALLESPDWEDRVKNFLNDRRRRRSV
jgi:hypothetical protein